MTGIASWLIPDDEPIDWRTKAFGSAQYGSTVAEIVDGTLTLDELPTPLMTIDVQAVEHNVGAMSAYLARRSVSLAPHGKTTMSPQLWRRQLEAGAWAITLATPWQLRVAAENGVKRIMHAGAVLSTADLRDIASRLDADRDMHIWIWADSPEEVALIRDGYPDSAPPLPILVDQGGPGARTGARTPSQAIATAESIAAAPHLRLSGFAVWEGSQAGADGTERRRLIVELLDRAAGTFREAVSRKLLDPADGPVVTGGGSEYFDLVADRWASLRELGARIVLRSGCYLTHDDGVYSDSSPFNTMAEGPLIAALHLWGQVVSRPETGLAILNFGRRDAPFDGTLPIPQAVRGRDEASSDRALSGSHLSALNDQHAYLRLGPQSDLRVGEIVRCGISHPCTAFDKWTMIPAVQDERVVGAIRTVF